MDHSGKWDSDRDSFATQNFQGKIKSQSAGAFTAFTSGKRILDDTEHLSTYVSPDTSGGFVKTVTRFRSGSMTETHNATDTSPHGIYHWSETRGQLVNAKKTSGPGNEIYQAQLTRISSTKSTK
jgi:hypothetical protein